MARPTAAKLETAVSSRAGRRFSAGSELAGVATWVRRKEPLEDAIEATRPSVFVVYAAGDAQVMEVHLVLPPAGEEALVQQVAVAQVTETFVSAHIQPYAGTGPLGVEGGRRARTGVEAAERRLDTRTAGVFRADAREDVTAVPPDAGGQDTELAKDLRVIESDRQRDQAAERAPGEAGVCWAGTGAKTAVDERLQFVDQKAGVERTFAAAVAPVAAWGVLVHTMVAGIGDADKDQGFGEPFASHAVRGGVRAPGAAGDVGGASVKEILPIVKVQNRK